MLNDGVQNTEIDVLLIAGAGGLFDRNLLSPKGTDLIIPFEGVADPLIHLSGGDMTNGIRR